MQKNDALDISQFTEDESAILHAFNGLSEEQRKVALSACERLVEAREQGGLEAALDQLINASSRKLSTGDGKKLAQSILEMVGNNDWPGVLNIIGRSSLH